MMGSGMGMLGPGCGSDYFIQELINDNGTLYYHVILGDEDSFGQEFYIRTSGCCWWESRGMGGGGMGRGNAPYSSSDGDVEDRLANAWLPLGPASSTGNGTGNPARIYMRQITKDSQMDQEFVKSSEFSKPRIRQDIASGELTSNFLLDMSNGSYNTYTNPTRIINKTSISGTGIGSGSGTFDATPDADAPNALMTAGRFNYTEGSGFGGSSGTYTYESGTYDIYAIDWISYCDPNQNPDHQCSFSRGGGGMGGGMGGGGRR